MSCSFWLRRKRLAAEKAKAEAAAANETAVAEETAVTEAAAEPETPKKQGKKTAKKAGAENDGATD